MGYELTDHEWTAIRPMLPNKPRCVPPVNDRRALNGIFWVLRSGAPWYDLRPLATRWRLGPHHERAGQRPRCVGTDDRHVDRPRASAWGLHHPNRKQSMGRSRGGLTSKIHAVVDTNGLPVRFALTAGEAHDSRVADKLLGV
jgi:transposase